MSENVSIDCGRCGLRLEFPGPTVFDGEEITCPDCGAINWMSVDVEDAYPGGYTCAHGKNGDEECAACDAEEDRKP